MLAQAVLAQAPVLCRRNWQRYRRAGDPELPGGSKLLGRRPPQRLKCCAGRKSPNIPPKTGRARALCRACPEPLRVSCSASPVGVGPMLEVRSGQANSLPGPSYRSPGFVDDSTLPISSGYLAHRGSWTAGSKKIARRENQKHLAEYQSL